MTQFDLPHVLVFRISIELENVEINSDFVEIIFKIVEINRKT